MQAIPFQTIQSSIDYICGITEAEDLDGISEALFAEQPDLAGFIMEFIEDMSDEAKDLGFMMVLILWKSFKEQYQNLRPMTEDEVVSKFEAEEADLEKLLNLNQDVLEGLQKQATQGGQPEVLNYLIQELFMTANEGEGDLKKGEEVHLFLIMKFYADAMNSLVNELELVKH